MNVTGGYGCLFKCNAVCLCKSKNRCFNQVLLDNLNLGLTKKMSENYSKGYQISHGVSEVSAAQPAYHVNMVSNTCGHVLSTVKQKWLQPHGKLYTSACAARQMPLCCWCAPFKHTANRSLSRIALTGTHHGMDLCPRPVDPHWGYSQFKHTIQCVAA